MRHRFHALCPYFAMFPEDFARGWIDRLSVAGDVILDPFCGRGTTPFEAVLSNRIGIGADINPVAYCVTAAKVDPPAARQLLRRLNVLEKGYTGERSDICLPEFFGQAFTPQVLSQLLYLRERLTWRKSKTDRMIAAILLGVLHGESKRSSRYLSNQMPRTIATKPAYSVRYWRERGLVAPERDVFKALRAEVGYRYVSAPAPTTGLVYLADFRDLPRLLRECKLKPSLVVTSPPYLDTTRFEEDQWLRLWFLGNPPRPTYGKVSKDDRYDSISSYWKLISDMWRVLGVVLRRRSHVVIRIGAKRLSEQQIVSGVAACAVFSGRRVSLVSSSVSHIQRGQRKAFQPQGTGCRVEVDCHLEVR